PLCRRYASRHRADAPPGADREHRRAECRGGHGRPVRHAGRRVAPGELPGEPPRLPAAGPPALSLVRPARPLRPQLPERLLAAVSAGTVGQHGPDQSHRTAPWRQRRAPAGAGAGQWGGAHRARQRVERRRARAVSPRAANGRGARPGTRRAALLGMLGFASPLVGQEAPPPVPRIADLPASVRAAGLAGASVGLPGFAAVVFDNPSAIGPIRVLSLEGAYARLPDDRWYTT